MALVVSHRRNLRLTEKRLKKSDKHTRQEFYSRYFLDLKLCHNSISLYDLRPRDLLVSFTLTHTLFYWHF